MARKTIYQRIALEGGDAIKDALKRLGVDGEKAFEQIGDAAEKVNGPSARFGKAMEGARRELSKLRQAGRDIRGELGRIGGAFGTAGRDALAFGRNVGAGAALLGTAAAGAAVAVTRLVAVSGASAQEIMNLSRAAGAAPEEFQRMTFAAREFGIGQEKLGDILKDVNDRVGDFIATGGGPMADFFENIAPQVGVTADQFARLSGPEALQLFVSSLEKAGVGSQEMTFYLEAMASDATLLLPLLQNNGAAMAQLAIEADRVGAVLSGEALKGLQSARTALTQAGSALDGVRLGIAAIYAPLIEVFADTFTEVINENRRLLDLLATQSLLYVIQLIRDLLNVFTGNDAEVSRQWMIAMRDGMIAFGEAASNVANTVVIPALKAINAMAEVLANALNETFGTNLTAKEVLIVLALGKITGAFRLMGSVAKAATVLVRGVLTLLVGPIVKALAGLAIALAAVTSWPAVMAAALATGALAIYRNWDELKAYGERAVDFLSGLFGRLGTILEKTFELARKVVRAGKEALGLGGDPAPAQGFSRGGKVSGPGTATSDSIPARLSDGEFVQRAAAVQHYGADFMAALNGLRIPKGAIQSLRGYAQGGIVRMREAIPRFANGGMVQIGGSIPTFAQAGMAQMRAALPGFAEGGLAEFASIPMRAAEPMLAAAAAPATGGRTVYLNIGGATYGPMTTGDDVVRELDRASIRQSSTSAGRKPSWSGAP